MSGSIATHPPGPDDAVLRSALEEVLAGTTGHHRTIADVRREPSPVRSSLHLENLDVQFTDGTRLALVFKDVGCKALIRRGCWNKPSFLCSPLREIETYRTILAQVGLGTATYYGATVDQAAGRFWLFAERVSGVELHQCGLPTWLAVAQWLAAMHTRCAPLVPQPMATAEVPLVRCDAAYYRRWIRRAQAALRLAGAGSGAQSALMWLAARYESLISRLTALPRTIIHGEFYASNVIVQAESAAMRICPVDWEMAAIGPGLLDLAALTAGRWPEQERLQLALAYRAALGNHPQRSPEPEAFLAALDLCRLHQAVQWLGWSPRATEAPHARIDWLGAALELAEKLEL
jgi:hypothetical protein